MKCPKQYRGQHSKAQKQNSYEILEVSMETEIQAKNESFFIPNEDYQAKKLVFFRIASWME